MIPDNYGNIFLSTYTQLYLYTNCGRFKNMLTSINIKYKLALYFIHNIDDTTMAAYLRIIKQTFICNGNYLPFQINARFITNNYFISGLIFYLSLIFTSLQKVSWCFCIITSKYLSLYENFLYPMC